jgi:superfamily I DNA/RNA helicase
MPRASLSNTTNSQSQNQNPDQSDGNRARLIQGSPEQEKIWQELLQGSKHVIIEAVAGSGKTTTLVQYAFREKQKRIGLVAFNKHIAQELTFRMNGQSNVECMTYHSLGYRAVRAAMRHPVRVEQYKTLQLIDELGIQGVDPKQERVAKYRIASMVGLAKTYGLSYSCSRERLEEIADRHDIDMNGLQEVILDYVPKILKKCRDETRIVDFDDMVWLPMELGLKIPKYEVLCVDEYQDTGLTQQWIAVRGGERIVAVGDPKQAIYQFRGADSAGFDRLRKELKDVVTLPLTLTRRCPKSHVKLAQEIVPQIRALDTAPEGIIRVSKSLDESVAEMKPGDLVVCRVNAELVGVAYKLLKRGVKAIVRGREIGQGISKLLEQAEARADKGANLNLILEKAGEITGEAIAKFNAMPNGKGEMRAANSQDRYDCLAELAQGSKTVEELKRTIERLFADFEEDGKPKEAVVLGTVHRTKGLEGNRVFILRPDLIPHPMAKKEADRESERNLGYVACTRAKFEEGKEAELIFVGGPCSMFAGSFDESFRESFRESFGQKEGRKNMTETNQEVEEEKEKEIELDVEEDPEVDRILQALREEEKPVEQPVQKPEPEWEF